jgi:DnaK suppressor protein
MLNDNFNLSKMLLEMKKKLLADAQKLLPQALTIKNDIGDEADQAGDERDREVSLLLTGRIKSSLMAIEEALGKIEEGTYGICEECGDKIEQGRLRVMPLTKLCLTCQSRVEVEMSLEKRAEEQLRYEQSATELEKKETD